MYPPNTVYVLSFYDVHAEQWVCKVYSKREDAEISGAMIFAVDACNDYTVNEARYVL